MNFLFTHGRRAASTLVVWTYHVAMTISVVPPSARLYLTGLLFAFASQAATVPLCVAAHRFRASSAVMTLCGLITVVVGLYIPPLLSEYVGTTAECVMGTFLGSTTYAFVALRMFGAAVGATPKGADADLSTWVTFATGGLDITFDADGKPIRPRKGAVMERLGWIMVRLVALSLISSLSEPFGGFPFPALLAVTQDSNGAMMMLATLLDRLLQLVLIWLFLSLCMDIAALLLLVQNFQPIEGFANPVFSSTSARIFWGKKWNLQVRPHVSPRALERRRPHAIVHGTRPVHRASSAQRSSFLFLPRRHFSALQ